MGALSVLLAGVATASFLSHLSPVMAAPAPQKSAGAAPSYARVAPILRAQCAGCHNPQGGAPFNLQSYDDAKQWGGQMLDVTQSRYMPPWLPAPDKGDFAGARRLSDAELATIRAWVGAGMPAGAARPSAAAAPAEWTLGKPDAVLTLAEPVTLPGNGPDVFTNLIVPVTTTEARTLRAIQIKPSDPQAVRSVWISIDASGKLQQADGMEPPAGLERGAEGLIFWQPGSPAVQPRSGEQWLVKPGSDLVLTTHLKTTGRKERWQMEIGLYYAVQPAAPSSPAAGTSLVLPLMHKGALDIPAAAAATTVEDSYTLPQAALATAIYPRAHFLARSLDAYAMTPAGKQVWLVSIPKWDADWLEVYSYRRPVLLPKGAVVHWKYVYDNTAENPHNPSDPPAEAHAGSGPKDEADGLMLELQPPAGADAAEWRRGFAAEAATTETTSSGAK